MLTISGCGACTRDQYIQLYAGVGAGSTYITEDDDGCGDFMGCSVLSYSIPANIGYMQYTIKQGCFGDSCNGNITVYGIITGNSI